MRLFDTASRKVVPFEPGPVVKMYVCGITPYDSTHLGHAATYLAYDLLHYATHHLPMPSPALRWLKRHHLLHHHATPDDRFGVSSPLWDFVLRTMPRERAERSDDERVRIR